MHRYTNIGEKDLLQLLQKGDETAFTQVFYQFQPALVFFANRLLSGQACIDAEEIVQDTFLKLFERKGTLVTLQNVKAFLYIVTKNACLDHIAKEQTRLRRFEKFITSFEESEDTILSEIVYAEALREVSMAIELLPEKCKVIMKQFFEEGKDAKEIAQGLNITVSTVNNQKSRAISLLKQRLSGAGIALLLLSI